MTPCRPERCARTPSHRKAFVLRERLFGAKDCARASPVPRPARRWYRGLPTPESPAEVLRGVHHPHTGTGHSEGDRHLFFFNS